MVRLGVGVIDKLCVSLSLILVWFTHALMGSMWLGGGGLRRGLLKGVCCCTNYFIRS